MKVYLAGGFIHGKDNDEDPLNWRYSVVKGLTEKDPYISKEGEPLRWGVLEDAIAGCLDYVGPFSEHQFDGGLPEFCKMAIQDADFVFAWIENYLHPAEISKVSTEIAYAHALGKPVGVGTEEEESTAMNNIWFVDQFKDFSTFPFCGKSPYQALIDFFLDALPFFPIEKRVNFWHKNHQAKALLGNRLRRCGYVYIIKADTGHYKVGRSKNVPGRMKLFAVKLPFKFEIINYFLCDDMYLAEKELHQVLARYHVNGEWFNLPQEVATLLANITEYVVFDEEAEVTYFCDKNDYTLDFGMSSLDEILAARKNLPPASNQRF